MGGHEMAPQTPPTLGSAPAKPGRSSDAWRSEAATAEGWRSEASRQRLALGSAAAESGVRGRAASLAGHAADVGGAGFDDAAVADVAGIVDRLEGGDHMAELVGVDLEGKGRG